MRFPPSFLDDIRARVSVSAVVGRSVQWDRRKSNPGRGDFWACCPFHTEKTPSFHADDRKGRYHCFGCKASGDIFTFMVEKEGVSFPEAVERLAAEAGLAMPKLTPEDMAREQRRANLYDVMELAAAFFEAALRRPEGAAARAYLESRGLGEEVRKEFRLGFAPDSKYALKGHLADQGVGAEQMIEAGLLIAGDDIAVPYDRFRNRIMFPIRDGRGRVIAFGGRALAPDAPAKYLNSPDTPLFRKGSVLYNLDRARGAAHSAGTVFLVEGYMDVIAMDRAGFANTVAPLGTALTEDQLGLLWRLAPEPILCFDGDDAGLKAAHRARDLALPLLKPGYSLKFILLPGGQDPDSILRVEGESALRRHVSQPIGLPDLIWTALVGSIGLENPDARSAVEMQIEQTARSIRDPIVSRHYRRSLRDRFWSELRAEGAVPRRRPQFSVDSKAASRLNQIKDHSEWEIVGCCMTMPALLDRHLERIVGLTFQDRFADAAIQVLVAECAANNTDHLNSGMDKVLDLLGRSGLGSAFSRYMRSTFLPVFSLRLRTDPQMVEEAFLSALAEVERKHALRSEARHVEADLEQAADDDVAERLGRPRATGGAPPVDESQLFALTQSLRSFSRSAKQVFDRRETGGAPMSTPR